jgi:lysophospholipase L1-like esterase
VRRTVTGAVPGPVERLIARGAAILLFATVLFCNEWVLARFFSPDRHLVPTTRAGIGALDIFCLALGLRLWRRKDSRILLKMAIAGFTTAGLLFALNEILTLRIKKLTQENPRGSYRLVPNLVFSNIQTNSYGMRWREVNKEKTPGTKRVAFIGDSFTFGCCADRIEQSFVGIFDQQFRSSGIETLNFGVGGYGLADMYLMLQEEVLDFHPDIVLLVFFGGNDFSDTFLSLEGNRVLGRSERWKNAKHKIPPGYMGSLVERNLDKVRKAQLYMLFLDASQNLYPSTKSVRKPHDFSVSGNFVACSFWCRADYPPIAVQARNRSLEIMDRIFQLCNLHNIRLVIASIPFSAEVYAQQMSGPDYDLRYPQKYVEQFAEARDIPYTDTLPAFRKYFQATRKELFVADGHFNNEGHRVAADAMTSFFQNHVK